MQDYIIQCSFVIESDEDEAWVKDYATRIMQLLRITLVHAAGFPPDNIMQVEVLKVGAAYNPKDKPI